MRQAGVAGNAINKLETALKYANKVKNLQLVDEKSNMAAKRFQSDKNPILSAPSSSSSSSFHSSSCSSLKGSAPHRRPPLPLPT